MLFYDIFSGAEGDNGLLILFLMLLVAIYTTRST